ncbi:MAG: adenylyl-sulfate kinase, partial [Actinobacteria bacterium]|nr:adenylyl-sulfate kinase [Actinomycetota bacterium]
SGQIVSGRLCPGDPVVVAPSNRPSRIERIVTFDGDLDEAVAGQSVTVTLADEIDVSRGDVLVAAGAPCKVADRFRADVVWMDDAEMLPGRSYLLKVGATTAQATLAAPRHRVDVNTMEHFEAETLTLNEIGECDVTLDRPVPFDAYHDDRHMGGFILVDRVTNATVAAGMLRSALRQSSDIRWQPTTVDKSARAAAKDQKPAVVWFTGLSGAGKSTIADIVESKLHGLGRHTYLLDGDNVRFGLNRDLGFSDADRVENLRRVTEVAALMADAGLIVLVSFISPFRSERRAARERIGEGEFVEVFVDTPLAVAESRDVKGLYAKARRGELANFTGIDSPYEPPEAPEITIDTTARSPEEAADAIVDRLLGREPTASVSR